MKEFFLGHDFLGFGKLLSFPPKLLREHIASGIRICLQLGISWYLMFSQLFRDAQKGARSSKVMGRFGYGSKNTGYPKKPVGKRKNVSPNHPKP